MECSLHVGRVQRRRLDEAEVVLLREGLGLVRGDGAEMAKVGLVANLKRKTDQMLQHYPDPEKKLLMFLF